MCQIVEEYIWCVHYGCLCFFKKKEKNGEMCVQMRFSYNCNPKNGILNRAFSIDEA